MNSARADGGARSPRSDTRRDAILDAATAVLTAGGWARLSLRTIAARAGMRVGNLQYYYRSKSDVVRAMLARSLERAAAQVAARITAAGGDADACLHVALDGVLADQAVGETGRFFRELWALAAHDADVDAAMREFYAAFWRKCVALFVAVNPALGRPRAERRAALMIAMLEGLRLFRDRRPPHGLPLPALERELHTVVERLALDR